VKTLQYFSEENLRKNSDLSADQIVQFLEDFRLLHGSQPAASKLISMKVPEDLLNAFKMKAKLTHTPYQAQIKVLMKNWVLS
jgi:predicted DNA binding CopG/RHH family protein